MDTYSGQFQWMPSEHCTSNVERYKLNIRCTIAALATFAGCAGSGEGLDQNGRPSTPGNTNTGVMGTVLTADFDSIQTNVFTPMCAVCHAGASAPRGLRLDAGNSYALLVGVASSEVPGLQRVNPGDPNASYIIQKLTGAAAVGQRMPLGGPYLPQTTIDVIRQWITNGAPGSVATQPAALTSAKSLRIATTAPLDGERADTSLAQIVIGFDRELDVNLVNSSTVMLEQLDSDTTVAANLSVPRVNPKNLLITPRAKLVAGTYRLVLRGTGGGALAGLNAGALNAPTGGSEGQDATITFTVETNTKVQL